MSGLINAKKKIIPDTELKCPYCNGRNKQKLSSGLLQNTSILKGDHPTKLFFSVTDVGQEERKDTKICASNQPNISNQVLQIY